MDVVVFTYVCASSVDQLSTSTDPRPTVKEQHALHITTDTSMSVMVQVWSGFLLRLFDVTAYRGALYSQVGNQGLLPVDYRDFQLELWKHWVFVSLFLPLSSVQPHGETIEDKFRLVRKRLEAYVYHDTLVVVTFGTLVEVHWWKCRPHCQRTDFEASGGSLTRRFKADLAVDNEKMGLKDYLSLVKTYWDRGVDIPPLESERTD